MKRLSMVCGLTAALALAIAGTASANTTLGSTAQPSGSSTGGGGCGPSQVIAQFTDNPSNPYFVPAAGKITQWQMNTSGATPGSAVTLVVLKPNPGGTFTVVGADARTVPSPLPAGNVASFTLTAPITVAAGDTLGLYMPTANTCAWFGGTIPAASTLVALVAPTAPAAGQTLDQRSTNPISPPSYTMNVAATFIPDNTFTLGKPKLNKKKGTATLNLTLPNPGELTATGNGVSAASAGRAVISKSVTAGPAQLLIKATGKKKKKLKKKGKVKLKVAVTYTPTGGDPASQSVKVKLKKNKKR